MNRKTYEERYLAAFNARDYEGVLSFYADNFEIVFAGYAFRGRDAVLKFYRFFHQYVNESITVEAFAANEHLVAIEARVRLEAHRDLTQDVLAEAGYGRLMGLREGQVVEIPQFIHYHLEGGKFVKALCAVFEAPAGPSTR